LQLKAFNHAIVGIFPCIGFPKFFVFPPKKSGTCGGFCSFESLTTLQLEKRPKIGSFNVVPLSVRVRDCLAFVGIDVSSLHVCG
jgi:hypothetical protein